VAKSAARVLLVDDNPLIVNLMKRAVEPLAEVACCTDAGQALARCLENPPDLLICDYRMPGLDGMALAGKLKENPKTTAVRVILVAAKSDIDTRLRAMADRVEEFFVKPFYVKELGLQTKKVLERIYWEAVQQQAPQEGVIQGRLTEMNLIDLLQSLELGQKTCALTLAREGQECRMFFTEGQITHAQMGPVEGDNAVYGVAGWADGSFQIDFNSRSEKRTTTRSTQGLLMEALRLLDEQNRDAPGG